jgi:hypothetical protein
MRVAPTDGSLNLLAIRIEQKFVVIKTMALLGSIRAVDTVSIQLAGTHFWQIPMPHHVSLLGKRDAKRLPPSGVVKQAKLHFLPVLGVQCEVNAFSVPGGSQRVGPARPHNGLQWNGHLSGTPKFKENQHGGPSH